MPYWLIPLLLLVLFESLADIAAKSWSLNKTAWLAFLSLGLYLLANSFWLFALKNGSGLGRGAVIFSILSAILAVVIGVFIYKEPLAKNQIIGFFLGIIAISFLFWE